MEEFPVLRKILDMEKQCGIPQLVTLVTLLDDDDAGRKAREYITRRNHNLSKYRDVFLLKRCMPLDTKNPKDLELSTKNCNRPWEFLDCEIEDLINREVVDCFVFENPGCLSRNIQEFNGAFHCDFTVAGKSKFCRFVNEFARLEDLSGIISVLKAMRYYMGFEVDGDINS